jgi:hypothetical protein
VTNLSSLASTVGVPYTAAYSDPRRIQFEISAKL